MKSILESLKSYLISSRKLRDVEMVFVLNDEGWTVSCLHSNSMGELIYWNILDSGVPTSEIEDVILASFWDSVFQAVNQ